MQQYVVNVLLKLLKMRGSLRKTPQQKMEAAQSLTRKGYQTRPLRRIYIPKKDGRLRPLSIPTMKCRAMQALHLLALEPIAEFKADKDSYGFRPKRSAADALEACHHALVFKGSSKWILEADIKSCFDKISHDWLRNNIPMDKEILSKWLSAGYIDKGVSHQTESGTPQGGLASPTLLVLTLSGLEQVVLKAISKRKDKVHLSIYADDFIFSAKISNTNSIKPYVDLFEASAVPVKRHIKIKAEATPYDPRFSEYFEKRTRYLRATRTGSKQPAMIK